MNSNASLEKLKNLLEQTQISLTKLTEQLDDEREKQRAIQNKLRVQKVIVGILCFYVGKAVG
jgi:predicted DNA-binding ribbon-helix-helix protein